jgi:hypothetical protein
MVTIRSAHAQSERAEAISRFNNPNEKVDALVTSLALSSVGINLHHCSHRMLVLEYPRNINTLIQGISRLIRMGQEFEQFIEILALQDSFDTYLEAQAASKYVTEVLADLQFPANVHQEARITLAHLVIANKLGQSSSKYNMATLDFEFYTELKSMVGYTTECALAHLAAPDDEDILKTFIKAHDVLTGRVTDRKKELRAARNINRATRTPKKSAALIADSDNEEASPDSALPSTPVSRPRVHHPRKRTIVDDSDSEDDFSPLLKKPRTGFDVSIPDHPSTAQSTTALTVTDKQSDQQDQDPMLLDPKPTSADGNSEHTPGSSDLTAEHVPANESQQQSATPNESQQQSATPNESQQQSATPNESQLAAVGDSKEEQGQRKG